MTNRPIPVQNIYYMLCYAWNRSIKRDNIDISQIKGNNLYDLLAHVLCKSLSAIIKKGIYKEYTLVHEETYSLKGKIDFDSSLKRNSFRNGRAFCEFDEFSDDIIHNQIIKATLYNLLKSTSVDSKIKEEIMKIYHYFGHITSIKLSKTDFDNAKIHRNNRHYKLSLEICRLIYKDMIVDESKGEISFNFKEQEKISYIFEDFVRNFYKIHLTANYVGREPIKWNLIGDEKDLLPKMETDITIKRNNEVIIMDTKYYKNTLARNMGKDKYHSTNMYQMFSYLKNAEVKGEEYRTSTGILLYPQVDLELNNSYKMEGHYLKICTVNLHDDWENIHNRLLEIIS